jgi:hypothetical protein
MKKHAGLIGAVMAVALAVVSFIAGASWNGRHQTKVEVARARFFEAAQGQFHWPEGKKEWADMTVPLGAFDFSEYGKEYRFTAMYEGVQRGCDLQVVVKDVDGKKRVSVDRSLDRSIPDDIVIDLDALRKDGLNLKRIAEFTLRLKSDGRAGRLLVGGLVSPRPALSRGGE